MEDMIKVNDLLQSVRDRYYANIYGKVEAYLFWANEPFQVGVRRNPSSEQPFYEIFGDVPEGLRNHPHKLIVLQGLLGHEFAHIVLGHAEEGHHKTTHTERDADRETIRRGLRDELLALRVYCEEAAHSRGKTVPADYLTSEEIRNC